MLEKKTDHRVIKTKRAIRNAFAELLGNKPIDDITVKDIAETADINRKTFYNHYANVHQVVDEIENEIVTAFEEDLTDFDFQKDIQDSQQVFSRLSRLISSDTDFYAKLFQDGASPRLMDKIAVVLRDKSISFFRDRSNGDFDTLSVVVDYTVSGILAVHKSWFLSGCTMPMDRLAKIVTELVTNGTKSFTDVCTDNNINAHNDVLKMS